jgi:hypothetical protein
MTNRQVDHEITFTPSASAVTRVFPGPYFGEVSNEIERDSHSVIFHQATKTLTLAALVIPAIVAGINPGTVPQLTLLTSTRVTTTRDFESQTFCHLVSGWPVAAPVNGGTIRIS